MLSFSGKRRTSASRTASCLFARMNLGIASRCAPIPLADAVSEKLGSLQVVMKHPERFCSFEGADTCLPCVHCSGSVQWVSTKRFAARSEFATQFEFHATWQPDKLCNPFASSLVCGFGVRKACNQSFPISMGRSYSSLASRWRQAPHNSARQDIARLSHEKRWAVLNESAIYNTRTRCLLD